MVNTIEWTARSLADLDDIWMHIQESDIQAATKLVLRIVDSTESVLSQNPNSGRPGRVRGTREWVVHQNYVVAYRVNGQSVQILTVFHAARLWPTAL